MYGALRRFGLDPAEADEVAQEVFLRAWRGLPRFEQRAQFSTWLYRIAFNEAQRRLSRRRPAPVTGRPRVAGPTRSLSLPERRSAVPRPVRSTMSSMRALEMALMELPPDWRVAVVLRDIEGLSTEEAAAVVGDRRSRRSRAGCIAAGCSLREPDRAVPDQLTPARQWHC